MAKYRLQYVLLRRGSRNFFQGGGSDFVKKNPTLIFFLSVTRTVLMKCKNFSQILKNLIRGGGGGGGVV
jgi:hypothetical protein